MSSIYYFLKNKFSLQNPHLRQFAHCAMIVFIDYDKGSLAMKYSFPAFENGFIRAAAASPALRVADCT